MMYRPDGGYASDMAATKNYRSYRKNPLSSGEFAGQSADA